MSEAASAARRAQIAAAYGKLPLVFEANRGQTDPRVKFLARGQGYTIFLTRNGAVLSLETSGKSKVEGRKGGLKLIKGNDETTEIVRLNLVGANAAPAISSLDEQSGKANYFIGNDPSKWRTNIPLYGKVRAVSVYPGINLVYYGNQGRLEYDFVAQPGADPGIIRLALDARNSKVRIGKNGDLVMETPAGEVRFSKPVVYQETGPQDSGLGAEGNRQTSIGNRRLLDGRFVLLAGNEVGFRVANYNHAEPLVIDPALVYSTLLVGTDNGSNGESIAVDGSGDAYVTGRTRSTDFPVSSTAVDKTFGGGTCGTDVCHDAFITKINATGTALVYSTYLGGSSEDDAVSVAIDSTGEAYVTGHTSSSNFPVTTSTAFQSALGTGTCNVGDGASACPDAFLTKLNSTGSGLVYSTYLGGNGPTTGTAGITGANAGLGVAVDSSGNAYLTGITASSSFPVTTGAFQSALAGVNACTLSSLLGNCPNAFVAEINPAASGSASLVYSTYLGGTGFTDYNPLSGSNGTNITGGIAVDGSGNIYVAGYTNAADFPHSSNNFGNGSAPGGSCTLYGVTANCGEGFVAKLNPAASGSASLVYSGFLGNANGDSAAAAIAVDSSGDAYVSGYTVLGSSNFSSVSFPTTTGAFQTSFQGTTYAGFIVKINAAGSAFVYSTYLGASGGDTNSLSMPGADEVGIKVDSSGDAYVVGATDSPNFPTVNPIQSVLNQGSGCTASASGGGTRDCEDAFIAELKPDGSGLLFSTYLGGGNDDVGQGIALDGSGNIYVTGQTSGGVSPGFPTTTGAFMTTLPGGVGNAAFVSKISLTLASTVVANPTSLTFSQQTVGTTSAAQTVTITNNTSASVSLTGISVTGTDSADFTAPASGSTCSTSTTLTASGGSCIMKVTFNPSAAGSSLTATLSVTTNSTVTPALSVSLSGAAISAGVVSFSPTSLSFGNQIVGTTSSQQVVTLTNTGTGAMVISNISVSPSDFANVLPTTTGATACLSLPGGSLAAGASCRIAVQFTPSATGLITGSVNITDDAAGSPQSFGLSGTGAAAVVTLGPSTLTFGAQVIGTTSAAMTATLTNSSTASVSLTGITVSGAAAADFTAPASGSTCTTTTPVAAGGTCTINVTFNPSTVGTLSATLGVTTSTISVPGVTLSGTALSAGVISLSVSSIPFGNVNVGTTSSASMVTLTNTGTGTLGSINFSIPAGAFEVSADTCTATLAMNANCSVSVTFSPTAIGSASGTLTVTADSANSPKTVSLTGTGTAATFAASPAGLSFGNQEVGTTSAPATLTITNGGNIALAISTVTLGGANASVFTIASNTCAGANVAPSSTCAVGVTFKPAASGAASATLTFADNVSTSPQVIDISGTGTVPVASLSAASLNLGTIVIGQTSGGQTVTLTNTGNAPLNVASVALSGANSANFAISSNTCLGGPISASATCAVSVTFAPTVNGAASATLTFTDDSGAVAGSTQTVSLTGTGTTVAIKVSPSSLSFGGVVVGTTSTAQAVTVSNIGTASVTFTAISVSASFAAASGSTCSTATPLAGGSSCIINVAFTPAAAGSATGTLTLADNDPSSPQVVALAGTGQDFKVNSFTTSQSVSPGGGTSYLLSVSPQGGFSGPVSLACSGAPSNSTCTVSPSSVTLNGSGYVAPTLEITTTAPSAAPPFAPPPSAPPALWILLLSLAVLFALVRRNSSLVAGRGKIVALTALLILTALWASCGGGGITPAQHTPSGGTPAGTYTLTVTGTSGNLTHSTNVTLHVQ